MGPGLQGGERGPWLGQEVLPGNQWEAAHWPKAQGLTGRRRGSLENRCKGMPKEPEVLSLNMHSH